MTSPHPAQSGRSSVHDPAIFSKVGPARRFPRGLGFRFLFLAALALPAASQPLLAQRLTTVRETEFRSRWTNYQVDRPGEDVAAELRPETVKPRTGRSLRSFFQNGPVVLRAALIAGWEYSDEQGQAAGAQETSDSSLFAAPVLALLYDREVGLWSVSARYSAGYLYYLDQNFVTVSDGNRGLSQTGGFDLIRKGSRLLLRSSTTGSAGSGYDIERGQETERVTLGEALSADYQLSEYVQLGALGRATYTSYDPGIVGSENTQNQFTGALFANYVWTGKTSVRAEMSAGTENQQAGPGSGFDRSYVQGLLGINYQPTAKLKFRTGLGLGVLEQSGTSAGASGDGLRTVYTLEADYTPTEKLAARVQIGLQGTSVEPEFSLALNWHPREATYVHLSIYQQTGLSTISFAENQTRRGVLGAVRQRLFGRVDVNLSAGIEEQESSNVDGSQTSQANDPYSFVSATLAWEFNPWLAWQVQYIRASGRNSSYETGDQAQTRASTSIRLTF